MLLLLCFPTLVIVFTLSVFAYKKLRFPRQKSYIVRPFLGGRNSTDGAKPAILAHRGGSCEAPENTLAAFKLAKENGAVGVEFDVDFTKDHRAVVIHDSTVDRTTDGSGAVRHFTFEDIRKLNASSNHPLRTKFPNEFIPSLDEAVAVCCNLGLKMYIEIKSGSQVDKTAALLKDLFSTYQLHDKALVCSYFPNLIYKLRVTDPNMVTAVVWWHGSLSYIITGGKTLDEITSPFKAKILDYIDTLWDTFLPWYIDFVGIPILSCGKELVCQHMVEKWKEIGVSVVAWTVNELVAKDYFMECLGCPVITDCVRRDTVVCSYRLDDDERMLLVRNGE